eukprot:4424148-Amphidinium_carterae.1
MEFAQVTSKEELKTWLGSLLTSPSEKEELVSELGDLELDVLKAQTKSDVVGLLQLMPTLSGASLVKKTALGHMIYNAMHPEQE